MTVVQTFRLGAVASAVLVLVACGGSDGGTVASDASGATVSGSSFKGPTAGATICAYQIDNAAAGKKGAKVSAQAGSAASVSNGCVVTANDGTYSFVLPAGTTGDLIFESTGGTYCSDESVFNGTSCAGGGTPIAMGANALRTVASPGATGAVTAPLTLLTTAATDSATGSLNASSFTTAYATVATNFGLTNKSPSAAPESTAELKTALTNLATYVGGDTSALDSIITSIAHGTLKVQGGSVTAEAAVQCSALSTAAPSDLAYHYLGMTLVNNVPTPTPMSYSLYGFSGCRDDADGNHTYVGFNASYSTLVKGGSAIQGSYNVSRYSGTCTQSNAQYLSGGYAAMTIQWLDDVALPLSATTNPSKSQAGTVSRLRMVVQPSEALGITQVTTWNHLACRTRAADIASNTAQVLFTSTSSPVVNGSFSRVDPNTVYTGYSD